MKGDPKVINTLIAAASLEAGLALQYHLDKRDLKFQGLNRLAKKLSGFGEDCECFTKEITDKVFLLGGSLKIEAGSVTEATSVTEVLQRSLDYEARIISAFNDSYVIAQNAKDADTRNEYEHWIKAHTHGHIAWLEKELSVIGQFGEAVYLQMELT